VDAPPSASKNKSTAATSADSTRGDSNKKRKTAGAGNQKVPATGTGTAKTGSRRSRIEKQLSPPPPPPHAPDQSALRALPPHQPPPYPAPPLPFAPPRLYGLPTQTLTTTEEAAFFEKVKRFLDDRAAHQEFLKLLTLFTQEIIDMPTLLSKAYLFIGANEDLFNQFKEIVGWDPVKDGLVEGEEWLIDNEYVLNRRFDLNTLKRYGPSYRKLPESASFRRTQRNASIEPLADRRVSQEIELACSGRDAHCWSVLNDEWVAFATWASEGAGAHKKNPYEDALAFCEQERHYYDHQIESNLRTIAVLEPIAAKIAKMTAEERAAFRLKPGLGSFGKSIYERIIKKVYGAETSQGRNEHGAEILQNLYENPGVSVPIILNRLKAKDEEWKRAQREWNRVWREVDLKNHYRALDHQAINFKSNEKKSMTTKSLVNEIEALRKDQRQKRVSIPSDVKSERPRHQFEFSLDDFDVVFDIMKLVLGYLDRVPGGYSRPERDRVETCLRLIVPLIFGFTSAELDERLAPLEPLAEGADDVDAESDLDGVSDAGTSVADDQTTPSVTARSTNGGGGGRNVMGRRGAADLRRRLLSRANGDNGRRRDVNGNFSPATPMVNGQSSAESPSSEPGEPIVKAGEDLSSTMNETKQPGGMPTWIAAGAEPWPAESDDIGDGVHLPSPPKGGPIGQGTKTVGRRYNFFCSTSFYCLVRLLHVSSSFSSD
jgi:paired amphipathic helix protein Sin3a